jgi:hypothetical protein
VDDVEALLPVVPSVATVVVVVLTVGLLVTPPAQVPEPDGTTRSWTASRTGGLVALVLLAALAAAARFGARSELDNPVPALVVGLGPVLLVLLPLLVTAARRSDRGTPGSAWPAVPAAVVATAYLAAVPGRAEPARLGAALAVVAVVAVAAALALGRGTAARLDPAGLLAAWVALGRDLVRWAPPAGATALLAVALGGAWCERWSRTASWAGSARDEADLWLLLGAWVLAALVLVALLARAAGATAAAVAVPLVVGAVVAGGLRRALISAQLLAEQAGLVDRVRADPLGLVGGQVAALAVVGVAGCVAAVVLARRSGPGSARLPGLSLLLVASAVSAWVAAQP